MDFASAKDVLNASPITVISTVLVLLLGVYYSLLRNRGLPPGPTGVPVLGYWPFFDDEKTHLQLTEMTKKYGDVFSFTVAGKLFIHLGSIKSIKEAHLVKADCFAGRYSEYSIVAIVFGKGIIGVNAEEWKALRNFFVQSFREYGLSSVKEYMADHIYDSVNKAVDSLKETNGSPVNIITIINDRSSDIFRRMMFNDAEISDEELSSILECYQNVLSIFVSKNLLLIGECARILIFPRVKMHKFAFENHQKMVELLTRLVQRHEKTYQEDNIRDVVDRYFKERNERRKKGDKTAEYFSDEALVHSLVQIVGDGVLGVAIFLAYFFYALLENPEEQEKIYKEIQDEIGPDREVTLSDRNKLPYTNAFFQEVMRKTDFFPMLPVYKCTKETTLNGFRIPKGAVTVMNFWAAHHDPSTFEEPYEFKPSRFISEPGKPKVELPVLFGVGKRSCAGESFAMMQVFLFTTAIVKSFRIERPKGDTKSFFLDGKMDICAYPRK